MQPLSGGHHLAATPGGSNEALEASAATTKIERISMYQNVPQVY